MRATGQRDRDEHDDDQHGLGGGGDGCVTMWGIWCGVLPLAHAIVQLAGATVHTDPTSHPAPITTSTCPTNAELLAAHPS